MLKWSVLVHTATMRVTTIRSCCDALPCVCNQGPPLPGQASNTDDAKSTTGTLISRLTHTKIYELVLRHFRMMIDPLVQYEPTEGLTGQGPVMLARMYLQGEVRTQMMKPVVTSTQRFRVC